MTTEMAEALIQLAYYAYGVIVAHFMISGVVAQMWAILREEAKREPQPIVSTSTPSQAALRTYPWQTAVVGISERTLYIASVQVGRPEFIALWLTLKTVARSRRWTQESSVPGRAIYNNFLAGNAMSILYSLVAAGGIEWSVGPRSLRNETLAIAVPTALLLGTGILWVVLHLVRRARRVPWSK